MKDKTKKTILLVCVFTFISFVIVVVIFFVFRQNIEYTLDDLIGSNTSTALFPCDEFTNKENAKEIAENLNDPKYKEIEKYINWISYSEVGPRCPGKYQLEVTFNSDWERVEIIKILKDQKIRGIPVYLRNV